MVPLRRRIPQVEAVDDGGVVPALAQIATCSRGIGGRLESLPIERDRIGNGGHEGLAPASLPLRPRVLGERHPGAPRQQLESSNEIDALGLFDPAEHVPTLAAPETVVETAGRVDGQGGGLLVVERAHGHDGTSRPLDLRHLGGELSKIGALPDLVDVVTRVCHRGECTEGAAVTTRRREARGREGKRERAPLFADGAAESAAGCCGA